MRRPLLLILLTLCAGLLSVTAALAANRPPDGLYAESAARTSSGEYSNGGVDLDVVAGGTKLEGLLRGSGVACYTGEDPPAGVPTNTELSIHLPRDVPISNGGSFSFSGPVTLKLTLEETGYEELTIKTTYTISGRFEAGKHGSYTAIGTDSSPICQPTTLKKFIAELSR